MNSMPTAPEVPQFDVGDVVKPNKPASPTGGVDCVIGHTDPGFLILFAAEHKSFFVMPDPGEFHWLQLVEKGRGVLTDAHLEMLKPIMQKWAYAPLFMSLGDSLQMMRQVHGVNAAERGYVQVSGFVPKPLADKWRHLIAMADLFKRTDATVPETQAMLLEWMLISAFSMIGEFPEIKRNLEEGNT
jgi:hypothetical protein